MTDKYIYIIIYFFKVKFIIDYTMISSWS